jgi:hypothetical protein
VHVSPVVQALPSSQAEPSALRGCEHTPVDGSHVPPVKHESGAATQTTGLPPTQTPPEHASICVQALPSSHDAVLLVWTQPVAGLQLSSVQGLPSSQPSAAPAWQLPPPQVSPIVQALPSSHEAVLLVWTQPVAGLQLSSVHALSSLQLGAGPPWQLPAPHVSAVVQALPSSQDAVLSVWTQPPDESQVSSVQGLLSLQSTVRLPAHTPLAHVSFAVQKLPSSQDAVLFVWTHPVAGSQESSVQGLLSLQSVAGPPAHAPLAQVSPVVQALPSSQNAVLFVLTQPVTGSQLSSVHTLASSQLGAEPPMQAPPPQVSFVVHALPSSQGAALST